MSWVLGWQAPSHQSQRFYFIIFYFILFSRKGFSVVFEPDLGLALLDKANHEFTGLCLPLATAFGGQFLRPCFYIQQLGLVLVAAFNSAQPHCLGTCFHYMSTVLFRMLGSSYILSARHTSMVAHFLLETKCIYLDVTCITLSYNICSKQLMWLRRGRMDNPSPISFYQFLP